MSTDAAVTVAATTSSAEMAHAREVYSTFDSDESGTIGSQELGDMLSALDIDASEEETAALFRYLDADGTGGVTFEQFQPWYSEAANAAKQSAEVFQGIIMSRRTCDSFDQTVVDQAVIKRAIECAIAAPVSFMCCVCISSPLVCLCRNAICQYSAHARHLSQLCAITHPTFFDIVNRIDDAPSLGASFSLVLKPLKRQLNLSGSLKETKAVRSKLGPVYLGGWS